jgi:hypothetical protein
MVVKSPAINWSETASAEKVRGSQQICADTSERDQIGRRIKSHANDAGRTLKMLLAFSRLGCSDRKALCAQVLKLGKSIGAHAGLTQVPNTQRCDALRCGSCRIALVCDLRPRAFFSPCASRSSLLISASWT